jgi:hypothetical protein
MERKEIHMKGKIPNSREATCEQNQYLISATSQSTKQTLQEESDVPNCMTSNVVCLITADLL